MVETGPDAGVTYMQNWMNIYGDRGITAEMIHATVDNFTATPMAWWQRLRRFGQVFVRQQFADPSQHGQGARADPQQLDEARRKAQADYNQSLASSAGGNPTQAGKGQSDSKGTGKGTGIYVPLCFLKCAKLRKIVVWQISKIVLVA